MIRFVFSTKKLVDPSQTWLLASIMRPTNQEIAMNANVGGFDKWARILGGSFFLGLVMVGAIGPWGLIGLIPLATGLFERCGLYSILGISTCKLKK